MKRFVTLHARFGQLSAKVASFSSSTQSPNYGPNLRTDILEASIKNVHALGWTQECIVKAVLDLGLPPLTHRVIGRGPVEVVEYFIEKKRNYAKECVATLHAEWNHPSSSKSSQPADTEEPNVSNNAHVEDFTEEIAQSGPDMDRILQVAIEAHIDFIAPYITTWPNALATFADPMQASFAMSTALQLADDIVSYGGIQTSRGDWYSERMLAIMLYSSTELFMLADNSPDLQDTK